MTIVRTGNNSTDQELYLLEQIANNVSGGGGGGGSTLNPVSVKNSNYSANANELIPVDTTNASVVITLPNDPADKTVLAIKHIIQGGTNTVTIICSGSSTFNKVGGSTTGSLLLLSQAMYLQYQASTKIWYVISDDVPLSQIDLRYYNPVGNIINNTFSTSSELSSYTNVGSASFTFNALGGLNVSGGTGSNFSNYFTNSWKSLLLDWDIIAEFINVSNGTGIAFGLPGLFAVMDTSGSGTRGNYSIWGDNSSPVSIANSSSPVVFNNGDTIRMTLSRRGTYVNLKVSKIVSGVETKYAPINYTQTLGVTASNALQTIGAPSIFAQGGNQTVTKFVYSSTVQKRPKFLLVGDSNGEGWCQAYDTVTSTASGSLNTTWAYRLSALTKQSMVRMCRAGGVMADFNNAISESLLINPEFALLDMGTNDARNGRTNVQFASDLSTAITSLVNAGITPILCKIIPNGTAGTNTLINTYNSDMATNWGNQYFIIDNNSILNATDDMLGGLHLNMLGAAKKAINTAVSLGSIGVTPSSPIGNFNNYLLNGSAANVSNRVNIFMGLLNSANSQKEIRLASRLNNITAGSEQTVFEIWGNDSSATSACMATFYGSRFGIGTGTAQPSASMHAKQATLGLPVLRLESNTTNDLPFLEQVQGKVNTTNNTITTVRQVAVTISKVWEAKCTVKVRCTGGSSGTVDDVAVYDMRAVIKTVAGVATLAYNNTSNVYVDSSLSTCTCVFDISGGNLRIRFTGLTNVNLTVDTSDFRYSAIGT